MQKSKEATQNKSRKEHVRVPMLVADFCRPIHFGYEKQYQATTISLFSARASRGAPSLARVTV